MRAIFGLAVALPVQAAPLDAASEKRVKAATMEVVARKPVQDSAIYEKALPLELLPYAYRPDEYLPVGTAFAIGTNRFVSAAHVLDGFIGSNFALTGLRDSTGRVYEIDQILKYSMPQDFVVFFLKDAPNIKPLEAQRRPAVGQAVYAVGNALGQGVVVRDGLYTSDTPEEWQGRWKWVRFSAAASPGSSGGPLLDAKGRVIGVVRGASPNENLNYAVPISLVLDGSETAAQFEAHGTFSLPMMTASTVTHLSQTAPLPRHIQTLPG